MHDSQKPTYKPGLSSYLVLPQATSEIEGFPWPELRMETLEMLVECTGSVWAWSGPRPPFLLVRSCCLPKDEPTNQTAATTKTIMTIGVNMLRGIAQP